MCSKSFVSDQLNLLFQTNSLSDDPQLATLPDIGGVIELLFGGSYRSAYCRKNFKYQYKIYREQRKSNDSMANSKQRTSSVGLKGLLRPSITTNVLNSSESCQNATAETESVDIVDIKSHVRNFIFEYPFNELFVWAVLVEKQEMAKFLWRQSTEPLAKALVAAKLYLAMGEEAEKSDSDFGSSEKLIKYAQEFLDLALALLEECYVYDDDLTSQLLTYELHQWSKQTCLSIAVNSGAKTFVSHNACQLLINDLWMGGLRINKNSNLKVIACILFPVLLFVIEFKTAEQLRLMPQTAEEHYAQEDELTSKYDSDSTSSSSSSSDSSENDGAVTSAGEEENVWGRIKKLKRRRKKSVSVSVINEPIELQQVTNEGVRKINSVHVRNGKIKLSKKVERDVKESLQQQVGIRMRKEDGASMVSMAYDNTLPRMSIDNQDPDTKSVISSRLTKEISHMKKIYEFYNAPITKFWAHTMAFFIFLSFYHWMVLVKLPKIPHWTEIYVICCVFTMSLEVAREVSAFFLLSLQRAKMCYEDAQNGPKELFRKCLLR